MKTFVEKNPNLKGIRLSMMNYEEQSWLENIPLYAFREYLQGRANSSIKIEYILNNK